MFYEFFKRPVMAILWKKLMTPEVRSLYRVIGHGKRVKSKVWIPIVQLLKRDNQKLFDVPKSHDFKYINYNGVERPTTKSYHNVTSKKQLFVAFCNISTYIFAS